MTTTHNNFLTSNGWKLQLDAAKYPGLSCAVQSFAFPGVSTKSGIMPSPRRDIPFPGTKQEYPAIKMSLLMDQDFATYTTLFDWWLSTSETSDVDLDDKTSEVRLQLVNSKANLTKTIVFVRAYPTDIGGFDLDVTDQNDTYITFDVTLDYSHFTIE